MKIDEIHDQGCACYMCKLNLDVKHTVSPLNTIALQVLKLIIFSIKIQDVLILSQFLRSDGCMLPKRITGLCKRQQKRIGTMVTMAHKAGLMSR